jgi:O-antigen biosynthesis protein
VALTPRPLLPTELSECLDGGTPVAVRLIDIETNVNALRLPHSSSGEPYRQLLALVRHDERPLGWICLAVSPDGEVSLDGLTACANASTNRDDSPAESREGPPESHGLATDGLYQPVGNSVPAAATESMLSVVVATCANAQSVVCCVEAIRSSVAGPFEIIVVENRPARSTVERALEERFPSDERIRYVEEHHSGLARARNTGLNAARGDLVAFTDDDVLVDPAWVPAVRAVFATAPDIGCVTGLILPLELETPAQLLVERFASFGKGFVPRIYSLDRPPPDQPLFPYTAGYFGSGANMAFRTDVIRGIGGFDSVLGTGTPARGGEDLDICIRVLRAGSRLAYEPRAIVWHRHPDTEARLRHRVFDYGAGLGAMLSKQIVAGPDRWKILSRAPQGIRYFMDPESRKNAGRGPVFPRSLSLLERVGLLYGPIAYLASRRDARR